MMTINEKKSEFYKKIKLKKCKFIWTKNEKNVLKRTKLKKNIDLKRMKLKKFTTIKNKKTLTYRDKKTSINIKMKMSLTIRCK